MSKEYYPDENIERVDESIGFTDRSDNMPELSVPMPGPMPPKPDDDDLPKPPFDPETLTNDEKIKVMESMFKFHPGQHVRNLLNENGYVHTIALTIDGRKLYGVIHSDSHFQYYCIEEIKPCGFHEHKDAKTPKRTDIDDSSFKQSFLKQQQNILKEELDEIKHTKRF